MAKKRKTRHEMIWIAWAIAFTASPVNCILNTVGVGIEVQIIHLIVCVICLILAVIYFVKNRKISLDKLN